MKLSQTLIWALVHVSTPTILAAQQTPPETPGDAQGHPDLWPAAHSPATITDSATEARITALIARMTVEQKVGQTIQADISEITPADLARYPLGSILAGGNSGPGGNERATAAEWHDLVAAFHAASMAKATNGVAIPILFGVDAVHGHNNLPGATVFPHNIGLGAAHDVDLIRRIGAATAAEVAASGIEWTFAPTLAVPQDLRWGRSYEGYAADPALVARYAEAMVLGLQGPLKAGRPLALDRVAATAKHFLADGGTAGGKDQGDAEISEAELIRLHAQGYPAAIDAGALTVMASFSGWNGVKHHGNRSLLTGVLKERMGFAGLVVGDWNAHGQVAGCTTTDCPAAINAGLDLYMAPDSWRGLYDSLLREVKDGTVPMARLDDAVRRILRVKAKLGMLDRVRPTERNYDAIGSAEHLALAREAVAKSLVLLKNDGVLPIRPSARVLVAGDGADNIGKQAGGWTITWQGTGTTPADFPNGESIWTGLDRAVRAAGGTATLSADGSFSDKPDVAIVVFGENPYAEFQGDVPTLAYQPNGGTDLALLNRLKAAGVPVVSVFLSGRPMFVNPEINASDAFVAAWLPGTQGGGVADVLVARADGAPNRDFSGRLPFPWPDDARSPVRDPLFAAGYGLSYGRTRFPVLSEDPGIDLAAALNVERYFDTGATQPPWAMTVVDAGRARPVGSAPVDSPAGAVRTRSVDVAAQEDGKQIMWSGPGRVSIDGPPADLARQQTGAFALTVRWRIDALTPGPLRVGLGGRPLDVSARVRAGPDPTVLRIPLRCFSAAGADIGAVGNAFSLEAPANSAITLTRVGLEPVGEPLTCPE